MAYAPRKKKSLWDNIVDTVGGAADKIIPGDQSTWRSGTTRANNAQVSPVSRPQAQQQPIIQPKPQESIFDKGKSMFEQAGKTTGAINDATYGTGVNIVKGIGGITQRAVGTATQAGTGIYGLGDALSSQIQGKTDEANEKSRKYTQLIKEMGNGQAIDGGRTSFMSTNTLEGKSKPTDFAKEYIAAGVDTSSLLPIGNVAKGVKAGTGLTVNAAKKIFVSNAKQAPIYGTSELVNDKVQGREITPTSVAMNYGAPLLLGSASEAGGVMLGSAGRQAGKTATKVNTAMEQANPRVKELDRARVNMQKAFDVETNPTRRAQINQGLTKLNKERESLTQGGYINGGQPRNEVDDLLDQAITPKPATVKIAPTSAQAKATVSVEPKPEPKTTRVYLKSKFSDRGAYADVPIIRKEENITLYQGAKAGDKRQFWTPNKKYAEQFGEVREKTGNFYQIDNGNRMTDVYVEADAKPTLQDALAGKSTKIAPNKSKTVKVNSDLERLQQRRAEFQRNPAEVEARVQAEAPEVPQRLTREDIQALEQEKAQYGAPEVFEPSKSDVRAYQKMVEPVSEQSERLSRATGRRATQASRSKWSRRDRLSSGTENGNTPIQNPDNMARNNPPYPDNTTPVDTKQYLKNLDKQQQEAGKGKTAGSSKRDDFKEKFIDDLAPIEDRLNKAIKAGADVDPKDHITYQLDRSRRSEGITQAYMKDNDLASIIQDVPDPKEFDQYLIARHAKELDAEITTGRNKQADAQLVKELDGKYGDYAKRVYSYNQKLLDSATEYGLISKELSASLKKQYPEYVPLNRIFKEDELGAFSGSGKGDASISTQGAVKKLEGSKRAIRSPLNSIIDKTRVVVEQGERNKAAQMLASYKDLPDNPFNLKELNANETIGNRNTIAFLDNGKKRVFEVDKEIADAAKNMTREEIGLWGRIAAAPARVLRLGATGVNAGFAGANIVKDIVGAAINSKHPVRVADPRNMGKALAAALNHNGKYYQELMREGVAGTSFDMHRNPLKSNIGEIRSQKNLARRAAYNATNPKQWYRTVENSIGRSEDFGRALQYYSNKSGFEAKGMSKADAKILAADQARNNSTNFFRHGSYGKNINMAIPYWNAGVQGARIQTRRIAERPAQTLAKIGMVIAAPSAMIAVNNYSDEKKRQIMSEISDYEKEGNIVIVGNDAKFNETTGRWDGVYKIPVPPQHIGIHKTIQDAVESSYTGKAFDLVKNLGAISENYTTVDPTDGRKLANRYTPQGLKLIAEPMTNTNFFTGNKIVPDSQKNLPAADQYNEYTSGTAKLLGKATNLSPRVLDNAIRTGSGGAGQNVVRFSDTALSKVGAIDKKEIQGTGVVDSVTNRFVGAKASPPGAKADEKFARLKEIVTKSDEYKKASQYDKSRMLNRLEGDLSAVEYNKAGKDDGKLTAKQKTLAEDGFKVETYTNLDGKTTELPKDIPSTAKSILESYNSMSTEDKKKWDKTTATGNTARTALNTWLGGKAEVPKISNEIARDWANYEKGIKDGSINVLEKDTKKKEILRKAYNEQLSDVEKTMYKLSKADIQRYAETGDITEANLNKALAVEKQLFDAGLISKETLASKLGVAARGYKGKTAKKSGGSGKGSGISPDAGGSYSHTGASKAAAVNKVKAKVVKIKPRTELKKITVKRSKSV